MPDIDIAIACSLTDEQLRERQEGLIRHIRELVIERKETENGIAARFDPDTAPIEEITQLIRLERACCPFLTFRMSFEPENGPIWLEISGPNGSKATIAEIFAS